MSNLFVELCCLYALQMIIAWFVCAGIYACVCYVCVCVCVCVCVHAHMYDLTELYHLAF